MKKRKAIGAFVKGAAYSLTALLAFSCGNSQQGGMPALSLAVMTVEPTSQELNSAYPATIKGQQDIEIRARVSGYITKLCVDEGAVVHKGQPLFLIDAVPYQKAVQAAEAAVEVAKANVATTQLTVDSKTELHAQNIISDYDLQTAKNSLASAKAALAQAEAQLASARNDLSYTTITSPSDGVVGTIPFRVGSLVGTTTQGKGTIQSSPQRLSDGSAVVVTVAKLVCGDGSCFDGTGLTVDVERPLTADEQTAYYDYTVENDPQIQRAVSTAQQMSGTTTVSGVNEAASSEAADSAAAESVAEGDAEAASAESTPAETAPAESEAAGESTASSSQE